MGKTTKATPMSKQPKPATSGSSRPITELLTPQAQGPRAQPQHNSPTQQRPAASNTSSPVSMTEAPAQAPVTTADLHSAVADIKLTLAAEIKQALADAVADLKAEVRATDVRVSAIEKSVKQQGAQMQALHQASWDHDNFLIDMHYHLEDLDNRGRRDNIRVRGLPEEVEEDHLEHTLSEVFNRVMGAPNDPPILFVRAHRALRQRGRESDPPRDTICCLVDFKIKEKIMRAARNHGPIVFRGKELSLFQDLSNITLQHRRALMPLRKILQNRGITYRWRFPFALAVTHAGVSAVLRYPSDLPAFCNRLQLPLIELPDWLAVLPTAAPRFNTQESQQPQHPGGDRETENLNRSDQNQLHKEGLNHTP